MEQITGISLESMAGGAAIERFNVELAKVAANILDPNTPDRKARKVILEVVIKPVSREHSVIEISTKTTLASPTPCTTQIIIGKDTDGSLVGSEHNPTQMNIPLGNHQPIRSNLIAIGGSK